MKSQFHLDDGRATSDPANANSLRGAEFARLLRLRETWTWGSSAVVAAATLGLLINPSTAWVLPLLAILVGLGVVFWVADRNAANAWTANWCRGSSGPWRSISMKKKRSA